MYYKIYICFFDCTLIIKLLIKCLTEHPDLDLGFALCASAVLWRPLRLGSLLTEDFGGHTLGTWWSRQPKVLCSGNLFLQRSLCEGIFPLFLNVPFPRVQGVVIGSLGSNMYIFILISYKEGLKSVSFFGHIGSVKQGGTGRFWKERSSWAFRSSFSIGSWLPFSEPECPCFGARRCHLVFLDEMKLLSFLWS